jgi:hypothetical protein
MRYAIGISVLLLAVVIAVSAWLDGQIVPYPEAGRLQAERAKTSLTGAACAGDSVCLGSAAPIASFGEFRRCGGYIESERAGPSRIACSEAGLTDLYLKGRGEGNTFYREFRRACRAHDFCYTHAASTYAPKDDPETVRASCDAALLADAVRDCTLLNPAPAKWRQRRACRWRGMAAYSSVAWLGRDAFIAKTAATCDYEPAAHGARDQVVSGRFVAAGAERPPDQVMTLTEEAEHAGLTIDLQQMTADGGSARITAIEKLTPGQVAIADREQYCAPSHMAGAQWAACPQTLADIGLMTEDWLRFAPVVVDSDGDGIDEVVLMSLTGGGLVLTHIKTGLDAANAVTFQTVKAFLALDRWGEFASSSGNHAAPLSGEYANQLLAHKFTVVQRPPAGCEVLPDQGPEDIVLMGARASTHPDSIARRFYRFAFDAPTGMWSLQRDQFTDDGHYMSQCAGVEDTGAPDHTSRLQYPALTVRGPVRCKGKGVVRETLSAVVRENCPSSTGKATAGYLNDVDLLSYNLAPEYRGDDDEADPAIRLKMVYPSWLPLTWNEAADPVMTSRAARRAGVLMVSAYVGGITGEAPRARFPLISALTLDPRLTLAAKEAWRQRLPDTVGLPSNQYALLQAKPPRHRLGARPEVASASPTQSKEVERPYWDRDAFGDPRMFFELPSILAPFSINGDAGLSVLLFANCSTYRVAHKATGCADSSATGIMGRNTLQILVAPVTGGLTPEGQLPEGAGRPPRWLECPVPAGASLSPAPVRADLIWQDAFLYNEPVLPGTFYTGSAGGGLAIAYRSAQGRIALMGLRKEGRSWKLGPATCQTLSRLGTADPARDVWMMKLN